MVMLCVVAAQRVGGHCRSRCSVVCGDRLHFGHVGVCVLSVRCLYDCSLGCSPDRSRERSTLFVRDNDDSVLCMGVGVSARILLGL